jgi:hypothetical protein
MDEAQLPSLEQINPNENETQNENKRKLDKNDNNILESERVVTNESTKTSVSIDMEPSNMSSDSHLQLAKKKPAVNCTLISNGQRSVIIIKPNGLNAKELINDPIEVTEQLEKSPFGKIDMKDVRINKKKGIIVTEIKEPNSDILASLLQIKKLGNWDISCYIPNREQYRCGVIWPVSARTNLESLKMKIIVEDSSCKLMNLERMKKRVNNEWIDSESIKLSFLCENLPESVTIGHSFYRIRPYVPPPVQCFNCQRIGHTAEGCRARVRCLLCGGQHNKDRCQNKENFKCAGCGGAHKANSRQCYLIQDARDIEKRKATGESFLAARENILNNREVLQNENVENHLVQHQVTAEIHHHLHSQPRTSYAAATAQSVQRGYQTQNNLGTNQYVNKYQEGNTYLQRTKESNMTSTGTQTEKQSECRCKGEHPKKSETEIVQDLVKKAVTEMTTRIGGCLTELFNGSIFRENDQNRKLLVKNVVQNYFGRSLENQMDTFQTKDRDGSLKRPFNEDGTNSEDNTNGKKEKCNNTTGKNIKETTTSEDIPTKIPLMRGSSNERGSLSIKGITATDAKRAAAFSAKAAT